MMTKSNLDLSKADEVAAEVLRTFDEDYSAEQIIPGLILAIQLLAEDSNDQYGVLSEADDLLVDGFPTGA